MIIVFTVYFIDNLSHSYFKSMYETIRQKRAIRKCVIQDRYDLIRE